MISVCETSFTLFLFNFLLLFKEIGCFLHTPCTHLHLLFLYAFFLMVAVANLDWNKSDSPMNLVIPKRVVDITQLHPIKNFEREFVN